MNAPELPDFVEGLPVSVFVLDADGRPCYANRAARELLGAGADPDVSLYELADAYHAYVAGSDERYPAERMPIVRALAGESSAVDDMEIRRAGEVVHLKVWAAPILEEDGRVAYAVAAFTDITEHKATERALRASEQQLTEAQAIAHLGSWNWDIQSNTVTWSDELFRIYGLEPQSVAVTYESFLEKLPAEDRPRIDAIVRQAYETGDPFSFVHRLVRPDGTVRWVDAQGQVETGEHGPARMFGTGLDITERKQTEDALRESLEEASRLARENERLHAEVRRQLEEVRRSRARLVEAADRERRRIERDLHDGAQQRLVTLSLALSVAQSRAAAGDSKAAHVTLEQAARELDLALSELRELARGIHPAILDEGLSAALESLAERSPVPATITAVPRTPLPRSIEVSAYFLVCEALANVAKHASASAVKISVEQLNGSVIIEVADDGVGGADANRGSGLRGLADRVAALNGRFELYSPKGGGTRVVAEIPCA